MATRWRRRSISRRLGDLVEAGESLAVIEHLGLGGWWVISDRALYVVARRSAPTRLAFSDIRAVRVTPGRTTTQVTVTAASGDGIVGDLHPDSALVQRLGDLP